MGQRVAAAVVFMLAPLFGCPSSGVSTLDGAALDATEVRDALVVPRDTGPVNADAAPMDAGPDAAPDGGIGLDAAAEDAAADDAAADDAAADDAAADAAAEDAAAEDAAADDAAANDATADDAAATPDAGPSPPPLDTLFVFSNATLYRYDTPTGELREVGPTGYGPLGILSTLYDRSAGVVRAIVDFTTAPTLATVDPCTGVVTRGPRLTLNGAPLPVAEGMAIDDQGVVFVSIKDNAVAGTVTRTLATLDLATGATTPIGQVTTLQNDIDQLVFAQGTLYGLDVDTAGGSAGIYQLDRATAATTLVVATSATLRRMIWDPVASGMLGATADAPDRRLVLVDLGTGALTTRVVTHSQAQQGGQIVDALVLVPEPACPRELLVNPGFEQPEPICGFPSGTGDWAVDASAQTTATLGVTPRTGTGMLRFISNGFAITNGMCGPAAGGAAADVAQLVDVSGCSAGTTLELSAAFDASAGASPGTGTCLLRTYTGTTADFGTTVETSGQQSAVTLDTNVATWQRCMVSLPIPAGTSYVAAYLSASSSALTRFADDARLHVTAGSCP